MSSYIADQCLDAICGDDRVLVLPDDYQLPSSLGNSSRVALVTFNIAGKLRAPVVRVRTRHDAVNRTAMPEAAKTLDDDSLTREHDIGAKPHARHQGHVLAEAKSASVQLAPECDLVAGIYRPIASHDRSH